MPSKPTVNDSFFPPLDDDFTYEEAWTTSAFLDLPSVQFMNLSDDDVLGVHRVNRQLTHSVVTLPSPPNDDGREQKAWEAFYPAGSANPRGDIPGGFGFYMHGPEAFAQRLATEDAVEMAIGYSVLFPDDWEWVKGGKLPGICECQAFSSTHTTLNPYDGRIRWRTWKLCVRMHGRATDRSRELLQSAAHVEVRDHDYPT